MSFNIGLSGLNAAGKSLNVTGNNIANVGSTGFKASRAEFADVYATSMFGSGSNATGSGVLTANISQQFAQGNITSTGNSLDLAISGNGFFVLSDNGSRLYTRNGTFSTDSAGYIVDNSGNRLQGYGIDANGVIINGPQTDLKVDTTNQVPQATTSIDQTVALNSAAAVPTTTPFDPATASSYNWSTSVDIFDSQGNSHTLSQYFVKDEAVNSWTMYVTVDGRNPAYPDGFDNEDALSAVDDLTSATATDVERALEDVPAGIRDAAVAAAADAGETVDMAKERIAAAITTASAGTYPFAATVKFDSSGNLLDPIESDDFSVDGKVLTLSNWQPATITDSTTDPVTWGANGATANPAGIQLDMRGSSQTSTSFAVNSVSQDGYTTGQMSGLSVNEDGTLFATYTNGQSKVIGQTILATFSNMQGLTAVGNTNWVESYASGEPVIGTPGSGTLGNLASGSLEDSNVDLTAELVNLIVAQRNYQANAKTIETESTISQTIIQMT